ncbi:hypothetical protein ACM66B_000544 [Microbotryomycetes sp. NB124-2]
MSTSTTVDAATFPNPWAEPLTAPVDKLNTYICVMPDLEPSNRQVVSRRYEDVFAQPTRD